MRRILRFFRNDENAAGRTRDELEFLPAALEILETPSSPRKRAVLMVCCLMVLAGLMCSWFGRVDIVAVAEGKVVPGDRAVVVRALHDGAIEQVFCEEGARVVTGEKLLSMESTETGTDLRQQEQQIRQAEEATQVLRREMEALDSGCLDAGVVSGVQTDSAKALAGSLHSARLGLAARKKEASYELDRLDADAAVKRAGLELVRKLLPLRRERYERAERLATGEAGTMSRAHVLEMLEALTETETSEVQGREEVAAIAAQRAATIARLETALADHRHDLGERLVEQVRLLEEGRIALTRLRKRYENNVVSAPVSGIVHQQAVRSPGTVVRGGETLLILIPGKEDLEIEAFASNLDVGWLRPGQAARIKVASFPFTRHGTLGGSIRRIGADAVEDSATKQLVFPVTVRLDPAQCPPELLSSLVPGMSCAAEIHMEKRRLLEVWLSPLRRTFSEAFRER